MISMQLSNLFSNVPAVLLFRPLIPFLDNPKIVWLTLTRATAFAGNLTLFGSVANLIVAESAKSKGIHISFVEYLKAGWPIIIMTPVIGILWLYFIA
jgi:Na+/H+ antiporter NhaD/arsenite permease-like protein